MSTHGAMVAWARGDQGFADGRYSRTHEWRFDGGAVVSASASPANVRPPMSDPAGVDPEEALVAAVSSCHMLWFLSLAQGAGWVVDAYVDAAEGVLAVGADGRRRIGRIVLRPVTTFAGEGPDPAALDALHHAAHERCDIAHSVTAEIVVEARLG